MERSTWKRAAGPVATLLAIIVIDLATHGPFGNPTLGVILYLGSLAFVVYAAFMGGLFSGLVSAALLSIYVLRFSAKPETGPIALTSAAFSGLAIMLLIAVGLAVTTRALARRQEKLQEALAQKNAELEASRRILAQAEGVAQIGSWEVDLRTREVRWSDGFYRILGLEPQRGPAPVERYFDAVPAEERAAAEAILADLYTQPKVLDFEQRIRRNGGDAWLRIRGEPLRDASGAPKRVVGNIQDITIQRETAEALEKARVEAESAAMAKAEFLANMSHEIRTPMNAVIGMTSLLLDTKLDDQQRDYAETIRSSGEHLLTIINDILDFSKIESGHLEIDRHAFDPERLVEEAMELAVPALGFKPVELVSDVALDMPRTVLGDAGRIRQVLVNLLSNAVKFTEEGEIVVTMTARPEGNGKLRIHTSVSDTGIGIPADRLGKLFKAFSQADTSTTREYGGTGLGLAISKRLVELMGGKISIESQVGKGTTFRFDVLVEAAPMEYGDADDQVAALKGARLLIVDDNETNVRIVSLKAERWGLVPRQTTKPLEALAWIERGDPFEVVVLDYHMPGMDGIELAQRIRALRPERPPLILLASSASRPAADRGLFAATITKPLKMSVLYNTLSQLLGGRGRRVRAGGAPTPVGLVSPLRILLTEDNSVNQKVAMRMLERLGYRADIAANGREAIEALERQDYDVVLMDVQMPVMDGLEATRAICARWERDERPRIIGLTAHALEEDEKRCREAGMDAYLAKPIQLEALAQALRRA